MKHTFQIQTSRVMKGGLRRAVKSIATNYNELVLSVSEDYGLLYGTSYFTVIGEAAQISEFLKRVKSVLEDIRRQMEE